jgi:hypothetical protein
VREGVVMPQVPQVRKIKAAEIVADIRARLTDFELMSKYNLSWERLQHVLKELVQGKAIRSAELEERSAYFDDPVNRKLTRASHRTYLRLPIPVEDVNESSTKGFITDLSETGFRTRGIVAKKGDGILFLIRAGGVSEVETFQLKATCKWAEKFDSDGMACEAGFAIVEISDKNLSNVRRLMQSLNFGNRNLNRPKSSGR